MILQLAIFDLDGTVLENEDVYGEAFSKVLKRLGVKTEKKRPHTRGIGVEENWPTLIEKYKIKTKKTTEELAQETQTEYKKLAKNLTIAKGFDQLAQDLKQSGILLALATSNTWSVVEAVFDALPIEKYFDVVTTGEETKTKKPDPEIFLITADKLGTKPEECIVFEDSKAGIEGAQNAGMIAIGVKGPEGENLDEADLVIDSFDDLNPSIVSGL